ncbi:hypothetical protein CANINC_002574 [Pichia inconspicua]|uniref:Enoyl reductase (ER) domain-containing protein n=1 Tax=Pichia inconspicua TaxID=52247 RepID=A0A4T0X144_9ASCO|nr:hypothetical protein CANINC_002574 [[Candida] inconspicua]
MSTITSKALSYHNFWDLSLRNVPVSLDIKPHEVVVKVHAVSINPTDIITQSISLFFIGSYLKVLGSDFAGEVYKAGARSKFKEGDSIYGFTLNPFSSKGTFSEYIIVDTKKAIFCDKIPRKMLCEQAAAIPCCTATAYGVLKTAIKRGKKDYVKGALEGKKLLIIGAGTSVGSYAVEIAKNYMHADNIVVTCGIRSEQKLEHAGADLCIDYHQGNTQNVNEILEFVKLNGKFDLVIDCVRNDFFISYLDSILKDPEEGGTITQVYGSRAMNIESATIFDHILPSWNYIKYKMLYLLGKFKFNVSQYKVSHDPTLNVVIREMWDMGRLDIPIDSIFRGWSQYDTAMHRVASSKAAGKVVCILD